MKLKIRHNNSIMRESCGICGIIDKFAGYPYWVFTVDDMAICPECLEEQDPILAEVIEKANLGWYLAERYEYDPKEDETAF